MLKTKLLILKKALTEFLNKSYIRANNSVIKTPGLFIRKLKNKLRFYYNYKALNVIINRNR